MNMKKCISIVIPVFNEAENILRLYEALCAIAGTLAATYEFVFLFIDDGSTDHGPEVIDRLVQTDPRVRVIEFSRNFGKEAATSAGLAQVQGDAAIMIDADLQHPPELLPAFIEKWEQGAEVVVGIRKKNHGEGIVKKVGSFLFYKLMDRISETKVTPNATDYRLLDRVVIDAFNRLTEKNRMTRGLIDWLGFRREYIYFNANERCAGTSGYSIIKLTKLAFSSVVSLSLLPLKFAGYLGIVITSISGIFGLFILIEKYLLDDPLGLNFSGPASVAMLAVFLVGIVLACLGLIALYIASIHHEVIDRPMYVIRKRR